jgi:deoxyribodipyrimidine photo-lyase
MMRALVWFRSDLRTDDNHALFHASHEADRGVASVFTICAPQWREHDWADAKVEFILRNLRCLSDRLKRRNIPLLIVSCPTFARVPRLLLNLARQHRCDALHFNREHEVNEARRDQTVTALFEREGVRVCQHEGQTIIPPDVLRTKAGSFYTVFTPFKRAWIAHFQEHGGGELLPQPRRQAELICLPDPIPENVRGFDVSNGQPELWPAGEERAARRLSRFIEKQIAHYKKRRDLPAVDGTSRLSPYLAAGVVSARRCLLEALEANRGRLHDGRVGASTWISELIWREFYRHVLVGFPRVSMGRAFDETTEQLIWRDDPQAFEAWCEGRTGVPIVDAGMRQLAQTGWMHNRLRMIVAMFLTKDLFIDWRRGERHFMRHLIDGDLASNNGGWQWSASTGTDAAPYFRIFNPYTQGRRFDPDGTFIRAYVPEIRGVDAKALHGPAALPADERLRLGYPEPICDHSQARQHAIAAFKSLRNKSLRRRRQ